MSQEGADKRKIENIVRLVGEQAELLEQLREVNAEIVAVLGGGPTIGARMRQVEIAWLAAWSSRYQGEYVFNRKTDPAHIKRLLKAFSPAELQVRMLTYIRSDEPFYTEGTKRHPFGIFVLAINDLATPHYDATLGAGPSDCTHLPRCKTDKAHTDLRRRERAAVR